MATTVRSVFFVSDGTGLTAESWGAALLAQFHQTPFDRHTIPFVHTPADAERCVARVNAAVVDSLKPLVFSTTVDPAIRSILATANCIFIDLFEQTVPVLEEHLQTASAPAMGLAHGISDTGHYQNRMAAVEYSLEHDDGQSLRALSQADIVLVAPSRCGKTPTSMYLALQYGVKAANFPLVDEEFVDHTLPPSLAAVASKAFGLIATPQRLSAVRSERRPNSKYASIEQCRFEVAAAEEIYRRYNIPYADSTSRSIEELASVAMDAKALRS